MSRTLDEETITAAMSPVAREMVALVGFTITLALCREFGGLKLWFARVLSDDSELVQRIGRAAADRLASKYGGGHIEVPLLRGVALLLRDSAIHSDLDAGAPLNELARRYRVSQRHLYRLLKATGDRH